MIVPHKTPDGTQLPAMYFKSTRSKRFEVTIDNVEEAVWHPKIIIDTKGTPEEYQTIVKWWFTSAQDDATYSENLMATYANLQNKTDHIKKAKGWLLQEASYSVNNTGSFNKRKKEISKYLNGWLRRSLDNQYNRR